MYIQQSGGTGFTLVGGDFNDPNTAPPPTGVTCTRVYTSTTSVASITADIASASITDPGDVICLQRGQIWSTPSGLLLSRSFANTNRVSICASTGTSCTDSGAANPKFQMTFNNSGSSGSNATCWRVPGGGGGYNITNIDCTAQGGEACGTGNEDHAQAFDNGSANVTVAGGTITGFCLSLTFEDGGAAANATNISVGTCANVQTWTGNPPSGRYLGTYGSVDNSTIAIHNTNYQVANAGNQSHLIDLSTGAANYAVAATRTNNLTIECSHFEPFGGGALVKAADGAGLVFRDNLCEDTAGSAIAMCLGFDSHGTDGRSYGWNGADIYRNQFNYLNANSSAVRSQIGQNIRMYNNIARLVAGGGRGLFQYDCKGHENDTPPDLHPAHLYAYNNTVFRSGNAGSPGQGPYGIFGNNGSSCDSTVPPPSDTLAVNNLIIETEAAGNPLPWTTDGGQTCASWSASGASADQVHHNFEYAPNHAVVLPACTADDDMIRGGATSGDDGAAGVASETATLPGLSGDPAWIGTMSTTFTPTSNASAVCGRGDSTYCTLAGTDYKSGVRTTCDIGAIACPP